MDFKEIFKAPYSTDDYGVYMFAQDDIIALTYYSNRTSYDGDILKQLCAFLNEESDIFEHKIKEYAQTPDDCFIMFENGDIIAVRSWGYLTGVLKLSNKDAAKIQDDFLDWVVNKIKESQNENKNK